MYGQDPKDMSYGYRGGLNAGSTYGGPSMYTDSSSHQDVQVRNSMSYEEGFSNAGLKTALSAEGRFSPKPSTPQGQWLRLAALAQ